MPRKKTKMQHPLPKTRRKGHRRRHGGRSRFVKFDYLSARSGQATEAQRVAERAGLRRGMARISPPDGPFRRALRAVRRACRPRSGAHAGVCRLLLLPPAPPATAAAGLRQAPARPPLNIIKKARGRRPSRRKTATFVTDLPPAAATRHPRGPQHACTQAIT